MSVNITFVNETPDNYYITLFQKPAKPNNDTLYSAAWQVLPVDSSDRAKLTYKSDYQVMFREREDTPNAKKGVTSRDTMIGDAWQFNDSGDFQNLEADTANGKSDGSVVPFFNKSRKTLEVGLGLDGNWLYVYPDLPANALMEIQPPKPELYALYSTEQPTSDRIESNPDPKRMAKIDLMSPGEHLLVLKLGESGEPEWELQ